MKYLIYFVIGLMFVSCISDEELQSQTNSPYQGNWYGSFSGSFSGSISFKIIETGSMGGTIKVDGVTEEISGYVFGTGKFDMSTRSGLAFSGYLNGNTSSGSWKKGTQSGSFSFSKQ